MSLVYSIINGTQYVFDSMEEYIKSTFNTELDIYTTIEMKIKGKNYSERKNNLRDKAIEYQNSYSACTGGSLSMEELFRLQSFFETQGKKYGLITEFRENGIC